MPFAFPFPPLDWKPIFELRARYERRDDRDLSRAASDDRSDLLSRLRVGTGFSSGKVAGQIVYQYAHDEDWEPNGNRALWRSDLLLAFAGTKVGAGDLTVGRQRLRFGSDRLLGIADWNNVSNAWDGARYAAGRLDLFAVKTGVLPSPDEEVRLAGAALGEGTNQTLAVFKHDRRAKSDEVTLSQLVRAKLGPASLDAEFVGQAGHRDDKRKLAGALDVIASVPVVPKLVFSVQGSVASGGGHGNTTNTFDQLYPSVHDHHGLSDLTGWKNVRDLGIALRYDPDMRTNVKLQYHRLGLDSARDAWYGAGGAANGRPGGKFIDPTGSRGRDVGDEIDLDASRALNPHQTIRAGAALFQPGRFVRSFNGSATKDSVFGYVQWAYRF